MFRYWFADTKTSTIGSWKIETKTAAFLLSLVRALHGYHRAYFLNASVLNGTSIRRLSCIRTDCGEL